MSDHNGWWLLYSMSSHIAYLHGLAEWQVLGTAYDVCFLPNVNNNCNYRFISMHCPVNMYSTAFKIV
jgi:hypothetical protein